MQADQVLQEVANRHAYPLVFATISGAHLYGFPSPDSDFDLRGCHLLPLEEVVGLQVGPESIDTTSFEHGLEIDLVTHDAFKFFNLVLKKNGYVLEQIFSPHVVASSPAHDELKAIARTCITRHHSHHYFGFAETQWRLFEKELPHRVKPLLYVYRVLLTGIHLMKTGEIEANLAVLNQEARLSHVDELIAQKRTGPEVSILETPNLEFHRSEYNRLRSELEAASQASTLPEAPSGKADLNDLLIRLRLGTTGG